MFDERKYCEQLLYFLLSFDVIRYKFRLILLSRDLLFWIEIDTDICVVLLYNISTCSNDASIAYDNNSLNIIQIQFKNSSDLPFFIFHVKCSNFCLYKCIA